jgi:hypothetical protein
MNAKGPVGFMIPKSVRLSPSPFKPH